MYYKMMIFMNFIESPPFREILANYLLHIRPSIESREDLLTSPVETLFIMSWTFGDRLARDLAPQLLRSKIYTMKSIG